jgi:hypothetical protein
MKRIVMVILLAATVSVLSLYAQSVRTVTFEGVTYQVVTTPRAFIMALQGSSPAALICKINDYATMMWDVMTERNRAQPRIDEDILISILMDVRIASNMQEVPAEQVLALMQGAFGGAPVKIEPNVDVYIFTPVNRQ